MKGTPDTIKKGLACHSDEPADCYGNCEYKYDACFPDCNAQLRKDALAYIQQLEAERNQALEDLRYIGKLRENNCTFCLFYNHGDGSKECIRCGMFGEDHWQWRGVPAKEG